MHDIGMQLVAEKKAAIERELAESKEKGRNDMRSRDLLTLLLKANMATDIPDSQRLSDDDVLARKCKFSRLHIICSTFFTQRFQRMSLPVVLFIGPRILTMYRSFLVAGHETTSVATTWCLFALTQDPEVQKKLRNELFTLDTETPSMDELNGLPYLDAVVRETLRVHAPVPMSYRMAVNDDTIPVSEPFVDRYGQVQDSIRYVPHRLDEARREEC